MWKSSWVLASSHGDFVVHGSDWQLRKPGLMSDRQLHLSAKCWIWTRVEFCKPQRGDSSQVPHSWPDSLSSCSYLSFGWHFLHHFLDRKHWSTVEKPGSVSGLDLNELCFAVRARLPWGWPPRTFLPSGSVCSSSREKSHFGGCGDITFGAFV